MKKIVLLASDTPHRRYFIKKLVTSGIIIDAIIFESTSIKPSFPVSPFFSEEEADYEKRNFFKDFDDQLDDQNIKIFESVNEPSCIEYLKVVKPDFGLVFGTRKLEADVIKQFKDGAINIHRGIAEEYRGLDTNLWAIYHSDIDNAGVTIHYVSQELDTGDIVFQERVIYPKNIQIFQLRYYETLLCAELSIKALIDYLSNRLTFRPQTKKGRYYSFMPLVMKELLPAKLERLKKNAFE